MKAFKVVTLAAILIFSSCSCDTTEEVDEDNFVCKSSNSTINGELDVVYCCQDHETVNPWRLVESSSVATLTIESCDNLQLNFACSSSDTNIKQLHLRILNKLQILPAEHPCYPESISFEVVHVNTIPSKAFTESQQLQSISFESCTIGTLEPHAFMALTNLKLFRLKNTMLKAVRSEAVQMSCSSSCSFEILGNNIEKLEPLAFRVSGPTVVIVGNFLTSMQTEVPSGAFETFEFSANSVTVVEKDAFSFAAGDVNIEVNYFGNIRSGAFRKIVPGNSKSPKAFVFKGNSIKYANTEGLQPDIAGYSKIQVEDNIIECTCANLTSGICKGSQFMTQEEICGH